MALEAAEAKATRLKEKIKECEDKLKDYEDILGVRRDEESPKKKPKKRLSRW